MSLPRAGPDRLPELVHQWSPASSCRDLGPPSTAKPTAAAAGALRASSSVVLFERIAFVGVQGNLIMYLTGPLGMSTAAAAASVNAWTGTVQVLPLVGALVADSLLGRYRAILVAGVLYLLGFHTPCAEALGADQLAPSDGDGDPGARASQSSFFNWFHFSVSWGACWAMMVLLLNQEPGQAKGLVVKLLPIWLTGLVFSAIYSQVFTLYTKQGSTLDRRLGDSVGLVVPAASLLCIVSITFIAVLPMYDRAVVPLARRVTGHHSGVTTLQRVGAGIATAGVAMAVAALVEARRLRVARDAGLVDRPDVAVPMSLWWLVPQYVLLGLAAALATIGLEEFFYSQVPDALRSVGLALSLSAMGAGNYASGMLVSAIDWATRSSNGESWFCDNLNRAHLDYFYWLLAGLAALDVAVFLHFASRYVYRNKGEL
ncbi:hypothetical protein ACP4OV_029947 [Aristida adscensionis]